MVGEYHIFYIFNLSYSQLTSNTPCINKANVILGFGALLWSTVVASIQAWATVDNVSNVPGFYWLSAFEGNTKFSNFVNGYLPVVSLLVIICILPLIFEKVAHTFENRKTKTDVQDSMLGRYFYYQVNYFTYPFIPGFCPFNLISFFQYFSIMSNIVG